MILRRFLSALLLFAVSAGSAAAEEASGSLRDLGRLLRDTNAGRLEALREILRERGIAFESQPFQDGEGTGSPAVNLVATFGAGPREIVLGAHYDAVKSKDGSLVSGMVDNGAGVLALVRVAEALKTEKLRHPVRVVFFGQEELGLRGSKAYVASRQPGAVLAAVNVDIVAYGDTLIYGGGKGEGNAPVYRALQRVCAERRLSCLEFSEFPAGDDRSFEAAGIPNVSIAFLPALEAHQLWLLLHGRQDSGLKEGFVPNILKTIHTPADTLDKADAATLEKVPGVLLELLRQLDKEGS